CVDRRVVTGLQPLGPAGAVAATAAANTWLVPQVGDGAQFGGGFGVNPGRAIDAIWAFNGSMVIDF
ncbi:MAG TPA: hypothetical protein VK463_01985, partial [Desulfomonilaceae bacterium]|nr:hypothetical protein [Desulfomonilaceae bacterium]